MQLFFLEYEPVTVINDDDIDDIVDDIEFLEKESNHSHSFPICVTNTFFSSWQSCRLFRRAAIVWK